MTFVCKGRSILFLVCNSGCSVYWGGASERFATPAIFISQARNATRRTLETRLLLTNRTGVKTGISRALVSIIVWGSFFYFILLALVSCGWAWTFSPILGYVSNNAIFNSFPVSETQVFRIATWVGSYRRFSRLRTSSIATLVTPWTSARAFCLFWPTSTTQGRTSINLLVFCHFAEPTIFVTLILVFWRLFFR